MKAKQVINQSVKVLPVRSSIPVLENALVTNNGKCQLSVTNIDTGIWFESDIDLNIVNNGSWLISKDNLKAVANGIDINNCMETTDISEYPCKPVITTENSWVIVEPDFIDNLKIALKSTSIDSDRTWTSGILLSPSFICATTGRYLYSKHTKVNAINKEVVIPGYAVKLLCGFKWDKLMIRVSSDHIEFRDKTKYLSAKLIDAQYPEIDRVYPKHTDYFTVDRKALLKEVKNIIAMFKGYKTDWRDIIIVDIKDNQLTLTAENFRLDNIKFTSQPITVEASGYFEGIKIGWNTYFTRIMLESFESDELTIECKDQLNPVLAYEPDSSFNQFTNRRDSYFILMPVRISDLTN